jgi:hypothetical protein
MIKKEGATALWKGLTKNIFEGSFAKVLYSAPNAAITMSLAEVIRGHLLQK